MRRWFRSFLPDHEAIHGNRWLAPFANTLLHPRLWHLNRHSAAGGVAVGLFCGLIPGPFQMLGAAICAVAFKVNLPLSLLLTLYTNPLTIIPLYIAAFAVGNFALNGKETFVHPPEWADQGLFVWTGQIIDWMLGLGLPLALGLVVLASAFAALGYVAVRLAWRIHSIRAWRRRRAARRTA